MGSAPFSSARLFISTVEIGPGLPDLHLLDSVHPPTNLRAASMQAPRFYAFETTSSPRGPPGVAFYRATVLRTSPICPELSSCTFCRHKNSTKKVLALLEPVNEGFPEVSYANLVVLAVNVALRQGASIPTLSYCKGRVDALEDDPNPNLLSILEPLREYETVIVGVRDRMKIAGLTVTHMVALAGRPRSTAYMTGLGYIGSYGEDNGGASIYVVVLKSVRGPPGVTIRG